MCALNPDAARVQRWLDARNAEIPFDARDQIRHEIDVTDRTITVLECRPPWREGFGPELTRFDQWRPEGIVRAW